MDTRTINAELDRDTADTDARGTSSPFRNDTGPFAGLYQPTPTEV